MSNPWAYKRAEVWGDVIARRLLADLVAERINVIGMSEIERASDAAIKVMIGRVDRAQLLDQASKRLVELVATGQLEDRLAVAGSRADQDAG